MQDARGGGQGGQGSGGSGRGFASCLLLLCFICFGFGMHFATLIAHIFAGPFLDLLFNNI